MSNDRHHDEQVSAAYQDLARERVPEHLDNSVLRMAKASVERPKYSRWTAWSRPLAWAATVALCLAITLQITQVPTPDGMATEFSPPEVAAPASALAPELQKDKREQASEPTSDRNIAQPLKLSESMSDGISSEKIAPARRAAKQTANEPATAGRMRQSADLDEAESIEEEMVKQEMAIEVKEASELRREDASFSVGYAASGALAADMPIDECPEENRAEPESWLECIDALEASGDVEAASRQREKLIEVFPDFKLP